MRNIPIILSKGDMFLATATGQVRHSEALKSGRKDSHGFTVKQDPLNVHIDGVCGEFSVCRWKGIPYVPTFNTYHKKPDIEPDIEVRTRSADWHDLYVRDDDNLNYRFVLVTGERPPQFIIRGWCWGHEAKERGVWKDPNGRGAAWWVRQDRLRDMDDHG